MSPKPSAYDRETKYIRILADAKKALDETKPPGIELWKYASEVILFGLAKIKQMQESSEVAEILKYDLAKHLGEMRPEKNESRRKQ